MEIKSYITKKKQQQEADIVKTLNDTIEALKKYIDGLDNGTVHPNVAKLTNEEQKNFAQQMIQNERFYANNGLEALKIAAHTIASHKMIDTAFVPEEEIIKK